MPDEMFESLLYFPDKIPRDMPPPRWTPAGASEVWLRDEDGTEIHGLWWDEPADRPAILFLHGNAQEVYSWSLVREDLEAARCRMLLIDYRGYGKSVGEPREAGLYMDGRAALDWLRDRGVPGASTVIFGKSLGGAVACEIARGRELAGLILESTFTSLASVAASLFPFARGAVPAGGAYDSLSKLPEIHCPVLVIHGDVDMLIPFDEGRRLFEAASDPKEMFVVHGAGHNDVAIIAGNEYGATISRWLDKSFPDSDL
ncbi:MAG: alpha/beta hydrolase [Candidatus Geothermincolia bacterium]